MGIQHLHHMVVLAAARNNSVNLQYRNRCRIRHMRCKWSRREGQATLPEGTREEIIVPSSPLPSSYCNDSALQPVGCTRKQHSPSC